MLEEENNYFKETAQIKLALLSSDYIKVEAGQNPLAFHLRYSGDGLLTIFDLILGFRKLLKKISQDGQVTEKKTQTTAAIHTFNTLWQCQASSGKRIFVSLLTSIDKNVVEISILTNSINFTNVPIFFN